MISAAKVLLTSLALLLGTTAAAIECPVGPFAVSVDLTRPVPTEPDILVEFREIAADQPLALEITGPRGVKIPLVPTSRGSTWAVVEPATPLQPNTLYQVADPSGEAVNVKFRTGAGPDTTTPNAPLVQSVDREYYTSRLGLKDRVVIVIDAKSDAMFWELEMSESMTFAEPVIVMSTRPTVRAGKSICLDNAPNYSTHADYYLRLRAIDSGGNPSEWSMLPKSRAVERKPAAPETK